MRRVMFVGQPDQDVLSGLRSRALRAKLLPYSQGGVLLALAAGEREGLTDRQWALFRLSGTSHLMAISGLHIGIATRLGWWLGRLVLGLATIPLPASLSPSIAVLFAAA
ncbi:MAG: putative membrane metal-binding protein [Paracoccaceae bacterium]|jgi:predicted membrane metal-binding protein